MGAEQTDAPAVNEPKMKRDVHLSVDLLKKLRPFKTETWRTERKTCIKKKKNVQSAVEVQLLTSSDFMRGKSRSLNRKEALLSSIASSRLYSEFGLFVIFFFKKTEKSKR